MGADTAQFSRQRAGVDEQDLNDLLELQRLTRALLDHLTAMFQVEEAADLLRAMADGLEASRVCEIGTADTAGSHGRH